MGRPTLLTPELQARLLTILRKGNYRQTACHAVGISPQTLIEWEHRGDRIGDEPYASFAEALKKAEAYAERRLLSTIRAAPQNWQAYAWILERKMPSKWSARVRATVNDEMATVMAKLKDRLDPETWLKVIRVLSEEDGASGAGDNGQPATPPHDS